MTKSGFDLATGTQLLPQNLYVCASGWFLTNATIESCAEAPSEKLFRLRGARGPRSHSHVGFRLPSIPVLHELRFACLMRGSRSGQKLRVIAYGYDGRNKIVMESTSAVSVDHHDWTPFECTIILPADAVCLALWINNLTTHPIEIRKPSLILGEHQPDHKTRRLRREDFSIPVNREATKVVIANYKACARPIKAGGEGIMTFPIPGPYRGQIPLTFGVATKPKTALIDYRVKQRDDGVNWIAEVRLKPPAKGAVITWESLVLIKGSTAPELPQVTVNAPSEAASWLRSTKCVQSDDPQIQAKAKELAAQVGDVEAYVRKVLSKYPSDVRTGDVIPLITAVHKNIEPLLQLWRAEKSSAAFRHFIDAWWEFTDKSTCSTDQRTQASNWLGDTATMDWLIQGYVDYSDKPWAAKLAECIDVL